MMASISERRLLHFKLGENMKELGADTWNSYIAAPARKGDVLKTVMGTVAAPIRAVLEGPDALYAGLVDKKLDYNGNRIIRDAKEIGSDAGNFVLNALTLHWGKALKNAAGLGLDIIRVPGSAVMEAGEAILGVDRGRAGRSIKPMAA